MSAAPAFRIYYDGGGTFDGDPWLAPALGVLVIVERDADHGRRLVTGKDYYVLRNGRWWAVDHVGFIDYLIEPGARRALFGRTVASDDWYAAMRCADQDKDFPVRTAWASNEERYP